MHNRGQRSAQPRFPHVHNLFEQIHSGVSQFSLSRTPYPVNATPVLRALVVAADLPQAGCLGRCFFLDTFLRALNSRGHWTLDLLAANISLRTRQEHHMKAVLFDHHGGPEVLRYTEAPEPELRSGEVLRAGVRLR